MNDSANYTIEQVIDKYLDLREQIDMITAEAKAKVEGLNKAKGVIESYLMAIANKTGQTQFGTGKGTAFITTKTGCSVSDWEAVKEHITATGAWHLLNKAVNKTAVGEYIEQHQAPPPGVEWSTMKEIQIRKKTTGKSLKEAA